MVDFTPNPLSRQEKLMAEQVVQLGNIVEQLEIISGGGQDTAGLSARIEELQQALAVLQQEKAELIQSLQQSQTVIASLQQQLAEGGTGSVVTPDDISQVMSHLNIEYEAD